MRTPAALVLIVLLTASCGSDESDREAKAAFIAEAEKVCAQANTEQKALSSQALSQPAAYVRKVVAIAERTTNQLEGLAVPDKDREEFTAKVIDPLRSQLELGKDFSAKVTAAERAKNQPELLRLLGNPPTETKADLRWMKGYGFDACVAAADTSD